MTTQTSRPHSRDPRRPLRTAHASGFTLLEALLAWGILIITLVGVIALLQLGSEIGREQTGIAEMQQSHRAAQNQLVRYTRLAGRGGLPLSLPPAPAPFAGRLLPGGVGVAVRSNVGDDEYISPGDSTTPLVLEDTDVLTVRGVMGGTVYQVNPAPQGGQFVLTPDTTNPTGGVVTVTDPSPSGVPQDLRGLADLVNPANPDRPEAVLLVSPLSDIFAVVQLDRGTSAVDDFADPTSVSLGFIVGNTGGSATADEYLTLSPGGDFSDQLLSVAAIGILEEYRFYVREEYSVPGDDGTEPKHRLSMARYYPGTERAYDDDPQNLAIDIADNLYDLQIALGVDTDGDGVIAESEPPDAADDWLFNSADDDPTDSVKWNGANPAAPPPLYYVRVTTLARTPLVERGFIAPPILAIEDRLYGEPDDPASSAELLERRYRRRLHQTVVDLRNL